YELVTGRQAFAGETVPEVCAAVMGTSHVPAHELRPDLPRRLVQAIDRCLQKNPQDRFLDVSELAVALGPFGSAKAPTSLVRFERVLSGAHATVANSSLPPLTPVSRPSTPRSPTQRFPDFETPTITTGAAVALLGDSQRRRRPFWIAAFAIVLATA